VAEDVLEIARVAARTGRENPKTLYPISSVVRRSRCRAGVVGRASPVQSPSPHLLERNTMLRAVIGSALSCAVLTAIFSGFLLAEQPAKTNGETSGDAAFKPIVEAPLEGHSTRLRHADPGSGPGCRVLSAPSAGIVRGSPQPKPIQNEKPSCETPLQKMTRGVHVAALICPTVMLFASRRRPDSNPLEFVRIFSRSRCGVRSRSARGRWPRGRRQRGCNHACAAMAGSKRNSGVPSVTTSFDHGHLCPVPRRN